MTGKLRVILALGAVISILTIHLNIQEGNAMPRDSQKGQPQHEAGRQYKPEVNTLNKLALVFAKAAAKHQDDKSDNLVLSSYNATTALSMLSKAANGQTKEELAQTLFGTDADAMDAEIDKLAALNAEILDANKEQVTLKTANGIWTNDDILTLNGNYAADLKNIFDAEINGEHFSDPTVPAKINKWASDNTNGLIDNIVENLTKDDYAILASALYFKGDWTKKFDKALTEDRGFTTDDGAVSDTPMMQQNFTKKGDITYLDGGDYEAVAMTYGEQDYKEGKEPTMRLVLMRPKDDSNAARDWLSDQADGQVPAWTDPTAFERVIGQVELPHMDIKQKHDLIPVLKEMGINTVFDEDYADLKGMIEEKNEQLAVNKVTHDVVFKTDEEGSEAAAVTTIGVIRATSIQMPPKRIDIKFDRSFAFALQDIKTGTVLFAGAVNKPNNEMKPKAAAKGPKR